MKLCVIALTDRKNFPKSFSTAEKKMKVLSNAILLLFLERLPTINLCEKKRREVETDVIFVTAMFANMDAAVMQLLLLLPPHSSQLTEHSVEHKL